MNKATIELTRIKGHWFSYNLVTPPFNDSEDSRLLNALVAWSSEIENKDKKIYRHVLRTEQERIGEDGLAYDHKRNIWINREGGNYPSLPYDIPLCDLAYYLDIYYQ
jgi:hypothetical protein